MCTHDCCLFTKQGYYTVSLASCTVLQSLHNRLQKILLLNIFKKLTHNILTDIETFCNGPLPKIMNILFL